MQKSSLNRLATQESVERFLPEVSRRIKFKIQQYERKFVTPVFKFSDYDDDVLIRSHFTVPIHERLKTETTLAWREKLLELITKSIDWRQFEQLCKSILYLNKIKVTVTRATKDQGIDFYGIVQFGNYPEDTPTRFLFDLRLRIVGQAKHSTSSNKVTHPKVSSFGTEILRLRRNSSKYFEFLPDEFVSSPLPLVGIFITNAEYFPKAEEFAKEYGIIYWDGLQIAQDLAVPEVINKLLDTNQHLSPDRLLNFIELTSKDFELA